MPQYYTCLSNVRKDLHFCAHVARCGKCMQCILQSTNIGTVVYRMYSLHSCNITNVITAIQEQQPAFYGTSSQELEDFVGQSFTARMSLLVATSAFRLGSKCWSFQQCYLHCHCTFNIDVTVIFRRIRIESAV